jgi:hypothetical protein
MPRLKLLICLRSQFKQHIKDRRDPIKNRADKKPPDIKGSIKFTPTHSGVRNASTWQLFGGSNSRVPLTRSRSHSALISQHIHVRLRLQVSSGIYGIFIKQLLRPSRFYMPQMGKCAACTGVASLDVVPDQDATCCRLIAWPIAINTSLGATHVGCDLVGRRPPLLCFIHRLCVRVRPSLRRSTCLSTTSLAAP